MDLSLLFYLLLVFLTISMLSMLWKENPLFRFAQYSVVAVAASTTIISAIENIRTLAISPILAGTNYWVIIPIFGGILIFTNMLSKKYNWISKYPLGLILGAGTALALRGAIPSQIISQIQLVISKGVIGDGYITVSNLIFIITSITALIYFFFYFAHTNRVGKGLGKLGRFSVMVAFGATFGSDLMMNTIFLTYVIMYISLLGVPAPVEQSYIGAISVLVVVILFYYYLSKKQSNNIKEQEKKT